MSKLRIGLIGAGDIVRRFHLTPGWLGIPDCEVVAACDIREDAAKALAADFRIPQVFTDYNEMLKLGLDCVDVCTPNRIHTPAVLAALNAGAHVLCEKPLAVSVAEVRQMAEAAERNGRMLMTAQHMRFTDRCAALRKVIASGGAGDFYHARVHALRRNWVPLARGFIDRKISGGGPCMDIGVHALDTAMFLMDFPKPVRVTGKMSVNFARGWDIPGGWGEWDREAFSVEDHACGFVHFDNGATMVLEMSWLQHQKEAEDLSVSLFGRKGSMQWPSGEYQTAANGVLLAGTATPGIAVEKPRTEQIRAFVAAIREGRPSPVPVSQTVGVIAILEAIYQSSEQGREIAISL
ncbi:MAG: Gfo/Idh/MocA family oxidoreductase [Terrimicrobiaceae bacterium]